MSASKFSSHMKSLECVLRRQTTKNTPESRLVEAVLAKAILDQAIPSQRRNAQQFLASGRFEDWCGFVGAWIQILCWISQKTGLHPDEPKNKRRDHE